jgi:hypothetical protein
MTSLISTSRPIFRPNEIKNLKDNMKVKKGSKVYITISSRCSCPESDEDSSSSDEESCSEEDLSCSDEDLSCSDEDLSCSDEDLSCSDEESEEDSSSDEE